MLSREFSPLSTTDMQRIHDASLGVLQNTGLRLDHVKACKRLQDAGATFEPETNRVKFPPEMVEKVTGFEKGDALLSGRIVNNDAVCVRIAPRRTTEGGKNIRDKA